jgi:asparagine synthetase B (glutamine-hydrolysing)
MNHEHLLAKIDFKKAIIDMAKINRHPRCFKNDFGLFAFLDHIKYHTEMVISGKGIEFQLMGYYTIYKRIMETAIGVGDYSIGKAQQYLALKEVDCPNDIEWIAVQNVINAYKTQPNYTLDMVNWWIGTFNKYEIEKLTGNKQVDLIFDNISDIVHFIFEWFGREYVDNRLEDYGRAFGVECVTPYIDENVVNFIKTLPIELRKAINHHKFIFYEAMAHRVPEYVVQRPKEGLNTSQSYFDSHEGDVAELVVDYLLDRSMKIYDHIDYDELQTMTMNFDKTWLLLNLSIWMEHNASIKD